MTSALSHPDYPAFLAALKERILHARFSAARAVNRELVLLYWDLGRGIVEKQQIAGWGDAVVERLAADLQAEFPAMRGFSAANVWRMRQFYQLHAQPEFLAQVAREIGPISKGTTKSEFLAKAVREMAASVPWGHHVLMLGRIADPASRLYYLRATARFGWTRNVLLNQIKPRACVGLLRGFRQKDGGRKIGKSSPHPRGDGPRCSGCDRRCRVLEPNPLLLERGCCWAWGVRGWGWH